MESSASQAAETLFGVSLADHRLLVVDDSLVFRERLAKAMRDRGVAVLTAANYDEALEESRRSAPTLAILDLRMPGRSGLEVLRDLMQIQPTIKVLMLTGFGSIATAIDAIRLGAVNYLPKPADADDILAAFRRGEQGDIGDLGPDESEHDTPSLARAEWEHIHRVLADCGGNISEAARRLGIHRRSLQRKLRKRAPDS